MKSQAPQAICELVPSNASTNLLVSREAPPFDNPDLRRALALALDRKSFIWFPKLARKDYQIGLNNTGSGVDDPDQQFFENYGCGSERNYTSYCNPEREKRFVEQSEIADRDKRRRLVWDIDKQLQEDGARPIISHNRGATCMQPQLNGLTIMVNSQYNGWRMEDVWLDR